MQAILIRGQSIADTQHQDSLNIVFQFLGDGSVLVTVYFLTDFEYYLYEIRECNNTFLYFLHRFFFLLS